MNIEIDNKTIQIEPELLSIFNQTINVFASGSWDSTKISEFKKVKFNLKIILGKEKWNVPYLVLLKKDLKDEYVQEYQDKFIELSSKMGNTIDYTFKPSTLDIFEFSKFRFINKPYFEIFKDKFDESVFKVLNYIDTKNNSKISKEEYEYIDKSTFFNFSSQEIENIIFDETFVIREYRLQDLEFENIERINNHENANKWQIPNFNYNKSKFDSAKVFYRTVNNENGKQVLKNQGSLLVVVPKTYFAKYRPNFEETNRFLSNYNNFKSQTYKDFQGANIFVDTYDECLSILNNPEKLSKLRKETFLKRQKADRKSSNHNYDNGDWGGLYGEEAELGRWNTD